MRTSPRLRPFLAIMAAAAVFAVLTPALQAQVPIARNARDAELTRQELESLLEQLEMAASSSGYSSALRSQAAREAGFVRTRLEEGDFQVGDRVILQVEGEPELSDTLTVTSQRTLNLPEIGDLTLHGVLRSELQEHLSQELARFLRDPEVRATALIRIAVLGAVGSPGFYTLPAASLLEDALMAAEGLAPSADVSQTTVLRGQELLWEGDRLQQAMVDGLTLDQLSLKAGDRITVPERREGFFEGGILRTLLVTLPPLVYLLVTLTQ